MSNILTVIKRIKMKVGRLLTRPRHATVYFQGTLSDIPDPNKNDSIDIETLNLEDPNDQKEWLNIYNDAFERDWSQKEIEEYMLDHDHYEVLQTYLISDNNGHIGIVSVGHYIRNTNIGLVHNLAVCSDRQSEGWGEFLLLFAYNWLRNQGYDYINQERPLDRIESHNLSFKVGLEVKNNPDPWNIPPNGTKIARMIANNRVRKIKKSKK